MGDGSIHSKQMEKLYKGPEAEIICRFEKNENSAV